MSTTKKASSKKRPDASKKGKVTVVYPTMPRGYTAAQRAQLRKFEKELLKDRKVVID